MSYVITDINLPLFPSSTLHSQDLFNESDQINVVLNPHSQSWTALQRLPRLLDLCGPSFDSFALAAYCDTQILVLHAFGVLQEVVSSHASCVCAIRRHEFQHRQQKRANLLAFVGGEMILLVQHIWQGPVS
jgi:hypothetical protein